MEQQCIGNMHKVLLREISLTEFGKAQMLQQLLRTFSIVVSSYFVDSHKGEVSRSRKKERKQVI